MLTFSFLSSVAHSHIHLCCFQAFPQACNVNDIYDTLSKSRVSGFVLKWPMFELASIGMTLMVHHTVKSKAVSQQGD